jgi:hypothetical protein
VSESGAGLPWLRRALLAAAAAVGVSAGCSNAINTGPLGDGCGTGEVDADAVALQAREPNVKGHGEVSLAELVRWALRMSPDRVIVGEVRGREVVPMLNVMSQGNDASMTTLPCTPPPGTNDSLSEARPPPSPGKYRLCVRRRHGTCALVGVRDLAASVPPPRQTACGGLVGSVICAI